MFTSISLEDDHQNGILLQSVAHVMTHRIDLVGPMMYDVSVQAKVS